MKTFIFILLIALVGYACYYFFVLTNKPGAANCPPGSRYVRVVSGSGFVDTDPTDPWGSCVSESMIDNSYNQ
jgi:hypothetical protein